MVQPLNFERRRLLGAAVLTATAAEFALIGSAGLRSGSARCPRVMTGSPLPAIHSMTNHSHPANTWRPT